MSKINKHHAEIFVQELNWEKVPFTDEMEKIENWVLFLHIAF